jgi:AcrR family transcriptional regulator
MRIRILFDNARQILQFLPKKEWSTKMSKAVPREDKLDIPGVRPAEQLRSRLLQDRFVTAGRKIMVKTRLADLPIPDLAKEAGSSVGGFYSRFDNKDAFFEFLRLQMFDDHMKLHDEYLDPTRFADKTHKEVSSAFVDLMLLVFSGPWRGVLREAFSRIPEHPESWGPMTRRSQYLCNRILALYEPLVKNKDGLDQRVAFAVQLLFSAFDNEMMNPNLEFRISDTQFRNFLIQSFDALIAGQFDPLTPEDLA